MRFKTKRWITIISIVLSCVALTAVLGNVTGSFENLFKPDEWELYSVNEDNLYQSMTFVDTNAIFADGSDGVSVKLADNNVLKVSGTAEKALDVVIGTVTLKKGTAYLFDSSLNDGSKGTIYMTLENSSGTVLAASYNGVAYIAASDLSADTVVTLKLHVAQDEGGTYTLKPVICPGTDADDIVKYYA